MIAQIFLNSLSMALLLSLVAIGFNIIFNATKVFHLAHGAIFVSAIYGANFFKTLGVPLVVSAILGLLVVVILIYIIEILAYKPLYKSNAGHSISLITSLGVNMLIVSILAFLFSSEAIALHNSSNIIYQANGIVFTDITAIQITIATLVVSGVFLFSKTSYYTKIKAISDNYSVAEQFGINVEKTRLIALFVGSTLVGIAGILRGIEVGIDPYAGLSVTLTASVAVLTGGARSLLGTFLACFIIALIQNFSDLWLSAHWKEGLTYTLLLIVLVFFDEGLLTKKQRIEER
jgi:branched-chain amino acid transport system permease protein